MTRDIPKYIAWILVVGGAFWAAWLVVPTVGALASPETWRGRDAPIILYLVCGFLVYFGWLWRTQHVPSRLRAVILWGGSLVVNSVWPSIVAFGGDEAARGVIFHTIAGLWWLFASCLSLVALIVDTALWRHKAIRLTHGCRGDVAWMESSV